MLLTAIPSSSFDACKSIMHPEAWTASCVLLSVLLNNC